MIHDDLYQVGYDISAIPFFERKNGFVRILNKKGNYWLKESEVKSQSFEFVEWQRFLAENANEVLGFYANELGLNLREKPITDSKIIMTLKSNKPQIVLNTKTLDESQSRYHQRTRLRNEFERARNLVEIKEGWVKILDDRGLPNVHFYTRRC